MQRKAGAWQHNNRHTACVWHDHVALKLLPYRALSNFETKTAT